MEKGQHFCIHIDAYGLFSNAIQVRNDNPSIVHAEKNEMGRDLVLYAENPGECTLRFVSKNGKSTKCRVTVSFKKGFLNRKTMMRHGADACMNLMIVAHPDDEALWGGAHLKKGDYFIVCLTNGNNPIRAKEYRKVLSTSGSRGIILNYPDIYQKVKNDWSRVRPGVRSDIKKVINYKKWDRIVTYNPDGVTGHIHHRMTYADTVRVCRKEHLTDRLYYFGKYYPKGKVPEGLQRLSRQDLFFKKSLVDLYWHEMKSINHWWRQMIPYENWIKYSNWKKL